MWSCRSTRSDANEKKHDAPSNERGPCVHQVHKVMFHYSSNSVSHAAACSVEVSQLCTVYLCCTLLLALLLLLLLLLSPLLYEQAATDSASSHTVDWILVAIAAHQADLYLVAVLLAVTRRSL
jgi:hypothetical protein